MAGHDRPTTCSLSLEAALGGCRRLADLDEMSVRIADVAADLGFVLLRGGQEFRPSRAPFLVHGVDVSDPDVEEAAGPAGVWRDLEGHGGLVVGRASAAIDDDPAIGQ